MADGVGADSERGPAIDAEGRYAIVCQYLIVRRGRYGAGVCYIVAAQVVPGEYGRVGLGAAADYSEYAYEQGRYEGLDTHSTKIGIYRFTELCNS